MHHVKSYDQLDIGYNVLIDTVIDNAVNILFPIFKTYGWIWQGWQPTRADIKEKVYSLVDSCFSMLSNDDEMLDAVSSSGRLTVRVEKWGDGHDVTICLNVGQFYVELDKEAGDG